jgi:hypothetical protein
MAADGKGPTKNFCAMKGEVYVDRSAPTDLKADVLGDMLNGVTSPQALTAAKAPDLKECGPEKAEIDTGVKVQKPKAQTLRM